MSLNDGVLDDIYDDADTPIDTPVPLVVDPTKPADELEVNVYEELTGVDVKLKSIIDGEEKISELSGLVDNLEREGTINKSSFSLLSSAIESLATDMSIQDFTVTPTKVKHDEVMRHINSLIAVENFKIKEQTVDIATRDMEAVSKVVRYLTSTNGIEFRRNVINAADAATVVISEVSESKNTIVPIVTDGVTKFLDITTVPLTDLNFDSLIVDDPEYIVELEQARKTILFLFDGSELARVYRTCLAGVELLAKPEVMTDLPEQDISILQLMRFFKSESLFAYADSLDRELLELSDLLAGWVEEVKTANAICPESAGAIIRENNAEIVEYITAAMLTFSLVTSINSLIVPLETFMKLVLKFK